MMIFVTRASDVGAHASDTAAAMPNKADLLMSWFMSFSLVVVVMVVAVAAIVIVLAVVRVLEVSAGLVLEPGDAVHAGVGAGLDIAAAMPAREKLRIAAAVVDRRLRIRAHRPGSERRVLRRDRSRCVARLDPVHHRVEQRLRLRARAAAAMRDARCKEKAEPGLQLREA